MTQQSVILLTHPNGILYVTESKVQEEWPLS
jgi:hypothetical protein